MTPLRTLGIVLLLVAGCAFGAIFLSRNLRSLHTLTSSTAVRSGQPRHSVSTLSHTRAIPRGGGRDRGSRVGHDHASHDRASLNHGGAAPVGHRTATTIRRQAGHQAGRVFGVTLPGGSTLGLVGLEIAGGILLAFLAIAVLCARRSRAHRNRHYELYEVHLSAHDEAKPQDLEDMVEQIANIVRVFPRQRARNGQPYVAVELICGARQDDEMQWSLNVRCEPDVVKALDAAVSSAYPDVRIGHRHQDDPVPRRGWLREPGHVMRFRKERSFVYPLLASSELLASPPIEQIARAQIQLGEPSVVRFALTPTPTFFEEYARRLYKRHENKLVRHERMGLPEGGLMSTLNRAEMTDAQRTQNRSLFWLETQVAADTAEACKTVAAAVQSRRGENRLHRRWIMLRAGCIGAGSPKRGDR